MKSTLLCAFSFVITLLACSTSTKTKEKEDVATEKDSGNWIFSGVSNEAEFIEKSKEWLEENADCNLVLGVNNYEACAQSVTEIGAYNEPWPSGTTSTDFFNAIAGNTNLKRISFCFMQIDSIPVSIKELPNIEELHIPSPSITYLPDEIGELKKLKLLILGSSLDECMGSNIKHINPAIVGCESLSYLGLAYSMVEDLPDELLQCKDVHTIDLTGNKVISDEKIAKLCKKFWRIRILR